MVGECNAVFDQSSTYDKLIQLLNKGHACYRLIDHPPAGPTALASHLRGHPLEQAAKCIVLRIKVGKKISRYVLAVVSGEHRVDLNTLKGLFSGTYISFATAETAERLAGSVSGTILPFSFSEELELIVDPNLLVHEEIFFNAARLDQSIALNTNDYVTLSKPRIELIASKVF